MEKKTFINIYPKTHSWKQRLVVIISTVFGKPYYLTIGQHAVWNLIDRLNGKNVPD